MVVNAHRYRVSLAWKSYRFHSKFRRCPVYLYSLLKRQALADSKYFFKSACMRSLFFLIDSIGSLVFFPVRRRRKQFSSENISKILVIRLDHIGDLALSLPAFRALRMMYPKAQIDWLLPAEYEKLFRHNAENIRLIPFSSNWFARDFRWSRMSQSIRNLIKEIRDEHYDMAIDFRGDFRNIVFMFFCRIKWRLGYGNTGGDFLLTHTRHYDRKSHQVQVNLDLLETIGVRGQSELMPFVYPDEIKESLQLAYSEIFNRNNLICIHTGGGYKEKIWAISKFKDLIDKLLDSKYPVVLIGTMQEKDENPLETVIARGALDLRGKINLHELPAVLDQTALFIGCDSGPAHIAAAQQINMISIFSDMNPVEIWKPLSPKARIIHGNIHKISVDEVFNKAREILNGGVTHV